MDMVTYLLIQNACTNLTKDKAVNDKWSLFFRTMYEANISATDVLKLTAKDLDRLPMDLRQDLVGLAGGRRRLFPFTLPAVSYMFNRIKGRANLSPKLTLRQIGSER